ncbi:MAG: caspase family protein, partial [Capsulimonadales bacterium]|nr:caspase family protein [Capsulimonadales bacterium]
LFELSTGKKVGTLRMNRPGDGMGAVAFAPDGSGAMVTGGAHGPPDSDFLMLWNATSPNDPRAGALLHGHERFVLAVAFSPDGKTIASAGRDRAIRLWNRTTGAPISVLGGAQQILAVAAQPGPDGKYLASGGADGLVRIWDRRTGERKLVLTGHTGSVTSVAYTPDGKLLASGGRDRTIRLWDAETGQAVRTVTAATGVVHALAFLPEGKGLIAGCAGKDGGNGTILRIATETGQVVKTFEETNTVGPVVAIAVSPDGTSVAAGTGTIGSSQVRFHDNETGALRKTDEIPMPVTSVAFSQDGKMVAVGTAQRMREDNASPVGEEIRLYHGQTFVYQKSLLGPRVRKDTDPDESPEAGIAALAFAEKGKALVSSGLDGCLRLWNPRTGNGPITTLPGQHLGEATGAIAVYGDDRVATGGRDNALLIHKTSSALETGLLLATLLSVSGDRPGDPDDDYLTVTGDGYYDGSSGAARRITWRVGDDLFPVEAYEDALRKPEEVRKALVGNVTDARSTPSGGNGVPPSAEPMIAPLRNRFARGEVVPPQVAFEIPSDGDSLPNANMVTVRVAVSDAKKVDRLEVLANGRAIGAKPIQLGSKPIQLGSKPIQLGSKPIQLGSKPIQLGSKPIQMGSKIIPSGHTIEQTFEVKVPIPAGNDPVTLTAVAYGADNLSGREQIHLLRGGSVGTGETGGNLYILAIGVSAYRNPRFNLKYARNDAEAFSNLWKAPTGGGIPLYNKVETRLVCDAEATTSGVRAALAKLLETATEKDTVALFLSGHGMRIGEGNYYFATTDIDPLTADSVAKTALPWTALQTTLAGIKARRVLLFLDACHSGGALGEGQQASGERMAELLAKRAGVLVFSSSRGSEYSYELDSRKHGAFTAALMEAIGGKADLDIAGGGKDGVITAEEMLAFLRARVPQLTENRQTPTCPLLRDFGDAYPIARLR